MIELFMAAIDPVTAILTRDWAALGGWSLFVGLAITVVLGAFREWWVPGSAHRRLQESTQLLLEANKNLTTQNGQLITANEISKYFFEATVPKRGEPKE